MQAGKLRDKVTILRWVSGTDPRWGAGGGWVSMNSLWANVTPISGNEKMASQGIQAEATHEVKMRYGADVTAKDRFIYRLRTFEILSVLDVDGRKRELTILCKEYPENG